MRVMFMTGEYIELARRVKAVQRDNVVRVVFGSQTALANLLGVDPSYINHVIWLRKSKAEIERFVTDQVRRVRPELVGLWELPTSEKQEAAI